jgi:hypothetical protein
LINHLLQEEIVSQQRRQQQDLIASISFHQWVSKGSCSSLTEIPFVQV